MLGESDVPESKETKGENSANEESEYWNGKTSCLYYYILFCLRCFTVELRSKKF